MRHSSVLGGVFSVSNAKGVDLSGRGGAAIDTPVGGAWTLPIGSLERAQKDFKARCTSANLAIFFLAFSANKPWMELCLF